VAICEMVFAIIFFVVFMMEMDKSIQVVNWVWSVSTVYVYTHTRTQTQRDTGRTRSTQTQIKDAFKSKLTVTQGLSKCH
jgi:hypothetical protein